MAAVQTDHELGGIKAPERNHQRAQLAASARRWVQWVLLRSERLKRRLHYFFFLAILAARFSFTVMAGFFLVVFFCVMPLAILSLL